MTVTTLAGEKIGAQKITCNRLFLLDKSHKFQNLYKVNIYSKTKYCSHYILFILSPTSLAYFFQNFFNPLQLLGISAY